jgi:hypothetical protein
MELVLIDRHAYYLRWCDKTRLKSSRIVWREDGSGKKRVSAAAVGTGIAAVELLDVELLRQKSGARDGLCAWRLKISLIGGIAAPFAEAAPEAAERA